jgi:hypothetical protein
MPSRTVTVLTECFSASRISERTAEIGVVVRGE